MNIRLAIPDLVSNSYFPALAAVALGHFSSYDLEVSVEHIFPVPACFEALRDGRVNMVATSAHGPLWAFPRWRGAKILCSLSQGMYWFLVLRSDLPVTKGDVQGLGGLTLAAAPGVETGLRQLLAAAGVDPQEQQIAIGLPPGGIPKGQSFGVAAAKALIRGEVDGFWANGMAAEVAIESGIARCVLDVRRGDGPPAAFHFTQPALTTTDEFLQQHPTVCENAVLAIKSTHAALKHDLSLSTQVAQHWFPPQEAALIERLVERDLPFYQTDVPVELIDGMNRFAVGAGLLEGPPVPYADIVALQLEHLW